MRSKITMPCKSTRFAYDFYGKPTEKIQRNTTKTVDLCSSCADKLRKVIEEQFGVLEIFNENTLGEFFEFKAADETKEGKS